MGKLNQKLRPCLWVADDKVEEAATFYVSTFKDGEIIEASSFNGKTLVMNIRILGQEFMILNGSRVPFTDAVSFVVHCKDQAEIDYYWNALTSDGGKESMCAWLKDKFGVSWQIVPDRMGELMKGPNGGAVAQAMMQMRKIIIADLEAAAAG
jgi:predicted 3-demethylubiquinone-9 3-methyltransferase (glyoxalase superfamily)